LLPEIYLISPEFLDALQSGAVAVTVNRRLSRLMRKQYDQRQSDAGKQAWQAPQILPWDAWTMQCYRQFRSVGENPQQLLGAEQSLYLWREIVEASELSGSLLNTAAAASLAQSAWALQQNWRLNLSQLRLSGDQRSYLARPLDGFLPVQQRGGRRRLRHRQIRSAARGDSRF
jgi:hypothetical protein